LADPLDKISCAATKLPRKAHAAASEARQELRRLMREELEAGRVSKAGIARALGVSRQRVQNMLEP
jgi:DNA invertase Pin-like site-specific DNA recombinase